MKKNLFNLSLLIIGILSYSPPAKAQADKPLSIDIHGGLNLTSLDGKDVGNTKGKIGFLLGVGVDYTFNSGFTLATGLDYVAKGVKTDDKAFGDTKIKANYISLPIHAGYKFEFQNESSLTLMAGPYFAYGVGGKSTFSADGGTLKNNTFDELKKFDFGLGFKFKYTIKHFNTFVGFDHGVITVAKSSIVDITAFNSNLFLGVGYSF